MATIDDMQNIAIDYIYDIYLWTVHTVLYLDVNEIHMYTYIHIYVCALMCIHEHILQLQHIYFCIQLQMQTYIYIYIYMCVCASLHDLVNIESKTYVR